MRKMMDSQPNKLKILVVEDHALVREAVVSLLEKEEAFSVVATAEDGRSATLLAMELKPDVILMDLSMPNTNGTEAIGTIKRRNPQIRVVVLTIHNSEEYLRAALRAGANGYVLKDDSSEELLAALRHVAAGRIYISPSICHNVVTEYLKGNGDVAEEPSYSWDKLTQREREVLKLVAEGVRNRDIASYLSLSEKTVEKHRSNLMKKLALHGAAQVTGYAIRNGLIDNI